MKIHPKVHSIILLVLVSSNIACAEPAATTNEVALNYFPSSPISSSRSTHVTEKQPLSCKIDSSTPSTLV